MLSLAPRSPGSGSHPTAVSHETHTRKAGPYRLYRALASGGMASVYLARGDSEQGPGRMLAVKLIHPHLANDREFVEMFMDEAELAAQIRHPNVCSVLDYDLRHGSSYLVMEYLIGESLASVVKRIERAERLDPTRLAACVARMLADACEGLHAAHELTSAGGEPLHVVHRDVSLENLFVTYDGVAKVMDFGVAAAAHKRHQTRTGMVKGKFAFVAPECLKGQKPDRRADIWGLGVIAWELLTGRRLFRRETDVDTLCAVSDGPIPRPSECRPGLPAALDAIVMRALAREPAQRYATARELGRDLSRFAAGLTSADVAAWLRELFPGGRERRQQILELAAQLGSDGDDVQPARTDPPAAPPTPVPLRSTAEPTLLTSIWSGPGAPSTSTQPRVAPVPSPASSWPGWPATWRGAVVVFAIATAGAVSALAAQALLSGSDRAAVEGAREIVVRIRIDPAASGAAAIAVESTPASR